MTARDPFAALVADAVRDVVRDVVREEVAALRADLARPAATATTWLNTKAAAAHLGVSTQFLEIARTRGDGPPYSKAKRFVRYDVAALDAWLAERNREHTSAKGRGR